MPPTFLGAACLAEATSMKARRLAARSREPTELRASKPASQSSMEEVELPPSSKSSTVEPGLRSASSSSARLKIRGSDAASSFALAAAMQAFLCFAHLPAASPASRRVRREASLSARTRRRIWNRHNSSWSSSTTRSTSSSSARAWRHCCARPSASARPAISMAKTATFKAAAELPSLHILRLHSQKRRELSQWRRVDARWA
mmetsp:Transcript_54316/g.137723  ORF Transcript_54316/g.137723 Transcript_54316/m.137723 type:complete len:202 (-) Transcript_54316:8-613(-)